MPALIPVDELIADLISRAAETRRIEEVPVSDCCGRILAESVVSGIDVPPADNSSMDGFAINVQAARKEGVTTFDVSDRIAAGYVGKPLASGTVARIFTGAPIPAGADAVVIQENTEAAGEGMVILKELPQPGENIRQRGQDIAAGTTILQRGDRIRPQEAALIASVGVARVKVFVPLRIAIMSTGDELVEPPQPLSAGQIYNSNHYALIALVRQSGMEPVDLGLVRDSAAATEAALTRGAASADCIISSGGVSVGEEDYVKAAIERLGKLEFWRVAIKPGKPIAFGQVNGIPFFGLPGNPVSTFVTFVMIAKPYLLRCQGKREVLPQPILAKARFSMPAGSRREYVRVRLQEDGGEMVVSLFGNQGSGVMSSLSWANGLALVDIGQAVVQGDTLKVFLLD